MHEEDMAIIKALVPVAWADGEYADREREMIDALLDAYDASDVEKEYVRTYASEKRTLDDIDLSELSADDRRVVLQHAVLLSFVDGKQAPEELALLESLAKRLHLNDDETKQIFDAGSKRARTFLELL